MAEWARIDVNFFRHPQVSRLRPAVQLGYLGMILYAQEHETDGVVADPCLRWCDVSAKDALAMEAAGLLERDGDEWRILGFLNHQKSREEMTTERQLARDRARRARQKRAFIEREAGE